MILANGSGAAPSKPKDFERQSRSSEMKRYFQRSNAWLAAAISLAIILMPIATFGQTQIKLHNNRFTPADDVKLGRQAGAEAEQQFPLCVTPQLTHTSNESVSVWL